MKHIWWINHHAVPPTVPGGTRHYSLAKEIMKLGDYKVTIINGSFDHLTPHFEEGSEWGASLPAPIIRSYDGVDFCSLPTPYYEGNASLGRLQNMRVFYKNAMKNLSPHNLTIIDKPEIIIGSTVHPLAAYAGYKLSHLYHVPFVYEVRDLWPLTLVEIGKISKYNPISLIFGYLDEKMAKAACLIITTAPLMKNYYIDNYQIDESKFIWITNGSSFISNSCRSISQREQKILKVGYTGALGHANGLCELLDVLSTIPQEIMEHFSFTFVGDGPLKVTLKDIAKKYKFRNVFFKDAIPKDEMYETLQSFDILLFSLVKSPIFRYGISPNKLADYHAAGKPIIEIISAQQTPVLMAQSGYHIDNLSELPSLLSRLLNDDEDTFLKMASNARKFAEEYYSWKHLAQKLNQKIKYIEENR